MKTRAGSPRAGLRVRAAGQAALPAEDDDEEADEDEDDEDDEDVVDGVGVEDDDESEELLAGVDSAGLAADSDGADESDDLPRESVR